MIDFSNRHLFTPFTHPESGVTFHILTHKVNCVSGKYRTLPVRESTTPSARASDGGNAQFCVCWRLHG